MEASGSRHRKPSGKLVVTNFRARAPVPSSSTKLAPAPPSSTAARGFFGGDESSALVAQPEGADHQCVDKRAATYISSVYARFRLEEV